MLLWSLHVLILPCSTFSHFFPGYYSMDVLVKASADKGVHLQALPLRPYSTNMLDALASKSGRVSQDTSWSLILVQASHYLALVKYKSGDVVLLDSKAKRPLMISSGSLSASIKQFSLKGLYLLSRQTTSCTVAWPTADNPVESWLLLPPAMQSEVCCMLSPDVLVQKNESQI